MQLLFVSHSAGLLGAERSLLEIVRGAVEDGHDVTITIPREGPLQDLLQACGASVQVISTAAWMGRLHRLPPVGLHRLWKARRGTAEHAALIQSLKPDLVITNTIAVPQGAWAAKRTGVPHWWIVRESFMHNGQLRSLLPKRWIARTVVRNSSQVFTVSLYVERQLRDASRDQSLSTRPIRPRPIERLHEADAPAEGRAGIHLLLPGFMSREKGQLTAVRAMALARRRTSANMTLDLVGRGPWLFVMVLRSTIRLSGLRDRVRIVAWTDDLAAHFHRADAVLMLARHEAFGRTMPEALAHGIPVIAFASGSAPEVLGPGGGEVVSPARATALAETLAVWASSTPQQWAERRNEAIRAGARFVAAPSQYSYLREVLELVGPGHSSTEP